MLPSDLPATVGPSTTLTMIADARYKHCLVSPAALDPLGVRL